MKGEIAEIVSIPDRVLGCFRQGLNKILWLIVEGVSIPDRVLGCFRQKAEPLAGYSAGFQSLIGF